MVIFTSVKILYIFNKMTTVFMKKLKLFLTISKMSGLISFCYTLETGLLSRHVNSTYYSILEILRLTIFILCSYYIYLGKTLVITQFNVIKYWMIIVIARITEKWMIKFINGIIEFDRKLLLFNELLPAVQLYPCNNTFWNIFIISFCIYFSGFQLYFALWDANPLSAFGYVASILFRSPVIIIFVVMITICFHLYYLGYRFVALNRLWKCLPTGLIALPGGWSNSEITVLVESIRLLHAELSELLKLFSLGYGPVLLVYFLITFVQAVFDMFLIIVFSDYRVKLGFMPYLFCLQYVAYTVSILYNAYRIIEQKKKIISYLRLNPIAELPYETKLQVKIFLNQISPNEPNEFTAFGIFNLNLKLGLSILVLMITVIATLIQMKEHPIMQYITNLLFNPLKKSN